MRAQPDRARARAVVFVSRKARGNAVRRPGGLRAALMLGAGAMACGAAMPASGTVSFAFNFNALANNAASTSIQAYMTSVFGAAVGVTGARAATTYNGDGHVVGPTLGTSDGATSGSDATHNHPGYDAFIINNGPGANQFTLDFGTFSIYSISFDWEIFPDASCSPTCNPAGPNWPDIELLVDGAAVPLWAMLGSGYPNPQAIGVSGILNLAGAHTLTFRDWPAEIGIDNLVINGCPATAPACLARNVPEPSSLPLAAAGLALAALGSRRRAPAR